MSEEDVTNQALDSERAAAQKRLTDKQAEVDAALAAKAKAEADDAADDAAIAQRDQTIQGLRQEVADLRAQLDQGSESLRQSLSSVQVFPDRTDFAGYQQFDKVFQVLDDLGIKRVRGNVGPQTTDRTIQFYTDANKNLGIKSWLTVGKPRVPFTQAQWDATEARIRKIPGVESLNGWNEPNDVRNASDPPLTNWVALTVAHQKALAALGAKLGIKVGTPSLWAGDLAVPPRDAAALKNGGMTPAHFDHIAYHLYPGKLGTLESFNTRYDTHEAQLQSAYGDSACPMVCTEYGWSVAPNQGATQAVRVTDEERAKRLSVLAKRFVDKKRGHSLFELLQQPDASGAEREDWLGIVSTSWARGATFDAYKQFLAG